MRPVFCLFLLLWATLAPVAPANPFFAMDTAIHDLQNLDQVKKLGYDGIGWKMGSAQENLDALRKAKTAGLTLYAFYSYSGATLAKSGLTWSPKLEEEIAALKDSGAILWLPVASRDFAHSSSEGDAIAVAGLQRLADLAANYQVRIALYPHQGNWVERVQDAVRIARQVNRPNLGVTFNLCHCLKMGDEAKIPELLAEAAPYLFLVTINGADTNAATAGWDRLIQPLDVGSYDVRPVLNQLKKLNYNGPIGLQAFGVKLPAKDSLARSMEGWKKLNP